MPRPYSDYVKVNKDFVPVFTESADKKYPMHWLTFYPHDTFKIILSDLIGSLEGDTSEKRKSLWVSGAYGTGKSFASFTLKHIIEDESDVVQNYFEKYGIQSTLFNRLQNVNAQSDIIVVHRSSSAGIVGDNRLFSAIQESIKNVLKSKGYSYLGGKTLYDKIIGILKDPNSSFNFKGAFLRNKNRLTEYANPEDVIKDLVDLGPDDSLNLLQTIIEIADADGFNFAQSETEMVQWLEDIIRTNNIKIVFIWDEFSEYFLRNQNSTGGLQELAHASFAIPFYFLLITHRRHDQFIYESDRRKILEARFKMNKIDMVPTTAFMLMCNAIEIEHDLRDDWNNICANLWFNIEKMVRNSLNIYADDIKDEDLKGLLPLHPFSALILQIISREVNSNQRTMFQFLCGDPDTSEVAQHNFRWFIENHDFTNWCYLTSDYIWDYFFHYDNMDLDEKAKNAINHYFTFENLCKNEDEKRVLKVALLLTALKHEKGRGTSNLLRPTLSNITFAFAGTDIADKIRSIMDGLVKRSVFGASPEGSSDVLYISHSQNIDEEKYKEKIASAKANFTFEKIITNPEYQLTSSFSPSGYAPLRFEYICATHKDLRTKTAKINAIEPNKIPLIFMFANDGVIDKEEVTTYVKRVIPKKEQWEQIKYDMTHNMQSVRFLAKVRVEIDIATRSAYFSLPDFGVPKRKNEAVVEAGVIEANKKHLLSPNAVWGIVELVCEEDFNSSRNITILKMTDFSPFCPYEIDLNYYCEARKDFKTSEWINILLAAIDYNPEGYVNEAQKLAMLSRLLPFIEKRVNLIELAPKGTGKSYLFSQLSKYGWLVSGGSISRAKMFYDINKRLHGLVSHYDFVALDEVKTITFPDKSEMQGALKGYLESPTGDYRVGDGQGNGEAGLVLLGNIKEENMNVNINMFLELPSFFYEDPALMDRFHGFIKGWDIPRMKENLKVNGWALNVEYFSEIMHMLREELIYRAIVDDILKVPKAADTRDSEAVKRICTGFLKLLFPHVKRTEDVNIEEFAKYCLQPALRMRGIILTQLGIMDAQFRGKSMPEITVNYQGRN